MIVDGDELSIDRGRQKYRLQLQDYPELAAFLDSIRGTLAGDRKALERNYQLSLDGSAARWTLQLLPLSAKMQKVVQRIRITGTHDQVDSIEIMQADGDSSVMTIPNWRRRNDGHPPSRHYGDRAVAGVLARLRCDHQPHPVHD
jgi:hypothetical protein